ncbi:hypothetical protein K438DRAFT_1995442 [Mycena galopus ATCC 62051]|nr:hypothetical protein K438DRAFT_1995442 [Mycena galopus ATCC 62051]
MRPCPLTQPSAPLHPSSLHATPFLVFSSSRCPLLAVGPAYTMCPPPPLPLRPFALQPQTPAPSLPPLRSLPPFSRFSLSCLLAARTPAHTPHPAACNQCYGWKKQITRARAAAKKAGKK